MTQQHPTDVDADACGVLLAAGAGRRAGGPKALRFDRDGTSWLLRSVAVLRAGGCKSVIVVLGCSADAARQLITDSEFNGDTHISVVEAPKWRHGMGHSLRAGLLSLPPGSWRAVVVHLVDLPDVTDAIVKRLLEHAAAGPDVLARATYDGQPGHPVLIGTDHLPAITAELTADIGAKEYLARHRVEAVECGDLATGQDRDG